jgi:putative membrane-bound dehydrogenase-like protein
MRPICGVILLMHCLTVPGHGLAAEPVRTIAEFSAPAVAQAWQAVNDGVMGGVSDGRFRITADKTLEFFGTLSLENNGGFASVRTKPAGLPFESGDTVVVRVKGDGREYLLNLHTKARRMAFSYRAPLPTAKGEWREVRVPLRDFIPTAFGRRVEGLGPVDPAEINGVGVMLSDKKPGPFAVELAWVKAEQPQPAAGTAAFPTPTNSEKAASRPMDPEEVCRTARLPEGFTLQVFAAEPDVQNPIGLCTDARGRVWVAENFTWAGNGLGTWDDSLRDRVVVLTDRDGDGRHDERRVFWDGGTRLTSVAVGLGGVWVIDLPHLLFIPDRNDDLVPDGPPEIVLDGLDEKSVGHTPANGLTWGPDGWLWARHGIQGTSRIGRPGAGDSQRVQVNTGVWRYHPTRRIVEKVMDGMTNSWGTDFDAHGETFVINTVIGHLWHAVHGSHVERMYGTDLEPNVYDLTPQVADHVHWDTGEQWNDIRHGVSDKTSAAGGGHAHIGLMIYQGAGWPAEYRGGVFTLNLHGRRINHDRLAARGAGYTATHAADMCFVADPWFRGMDLVAAPDGGVYIADWSDTGECHDHDGVHRTSGRIYKLAHRPAAGRPAEAAAGPVDLRQADGASLRRHLFATDQWWSRGAVREWQRRAAAGDDRGDDVAWLRGQVSAAADPLHRLRALWALAAIDGGVGKSLDEALLLETLDDGDAFVRSWGVRLLVDGCSPGGPQPSAAATTRLLRLAASDLAAPVQLHLASAIGRLTDDTAWKLARTLCGHDRYAADPQLPNLVWYGLAKSAPRYPDLGLALAAESALPRVRRNLARLLAGRIEDRPEIVAGVLEAAARGDAERRRDLVAGIADGLRGWSKASPPRGYAELSARLAATKDEATVQRLRELDVLFGEGRGLAEVRALVGDASASPEARRQAVRALVATTPPDGPAILFGLLSDRGMIAEAIAGLARYDHPETPQRTLQKLGIFAPADRAAVVDLLASRPAYANALLDAVEDGRIEPAEISAFHARQIADFGAPKLTERLGRLWGQVRVSAADKQALIATWKRNLSPEAVAAADAGRGRAIFVRDCGACHVLFGAGRKLGPDLTGSNRRNIDYLLENVIDPGASVGADFRAVTFVLEDGRSITGVISGSDDRTITVQTPQATLVLDRRQIDEQVVQQQSLMPEGLLSKLSDQDVRDLVAYLVSPGQVPLPATASDSAPEGR